MSDGTSQGIYLFTYLDSDPDTYLASLGTCSWLKHSSSTVIKPLEYKSKNPKVYILLFQVVTGKVTANIWNEEILPC